MKIDYDKILKGIILLTALILGTITAAWLLPSCSANYHLNKYQNKGGVCGKIDTIRTVRYDTLTNTFYKFDSLVIVNDRIVPQTRLETRIQYRIHKDTVRLNTETIKYQYKTVKDNNTMVEKTSFPWGALFALIFIVILAGIYIIHKFKK